MSPPLIFSASVGVCRFYSLHNNSQICPLLPVTPAKSWLGPFSALPSPTHLMASNSPLNICQKEPSIIQTHTHTRTRLCQLYISWEWDPIFLTWNTRPFVISPSQKGEVLKQATWQPVKSRIHTWRISGRHQWPKGVERAWLFRGICPARRLSTTHRGQYRCREGGQQDWPRIPVVEKQRVWDTVQRATEM